MQSGNAYFEVKRGWIGLYYLVRDKYDPASLAKGWMNTRNYSKVLDMPIREMTGANALGVANELLDFTKAGSWIRQVGPGDIMIYDDQTWLYIKSSDAGVFEGGEVHTLGMDTGISVVAIVDEAEPVAVS